MIRNAAQILAALALLLSAARPSALEPIPDKLVVLTFDDSVKSHATFVGPLLKRLGFGATFFITEGFTFTTDKQNYMTWEEIKGLHDLGFEIGNHTRNHAPVSKQTGAQLAADLEWIETRCAEHGIAKPTSFAYPGNDFDLRAVAALEKRGYLFARRGGAPEWPYEAGRGTPYDPAEDHPLLLPTAGDARPDWTLEKLKTATNAARDGRIAILQFHGVPDTEHPWVHTPQERFAEYMEYLKTGGFTVIAQRDLRRFVDPAKKPADPMAVIERRRAANAKSEPQSPTK